MLYGRPQRFAAAIVISFILAAAAAAPAAFAAGKDSGHVALTRDHIARFLAVYPKIRAIGTRHAKRDGRELSKADDPLSTLVRLASDDALRSDVEAVVKKNGFASLQEWFKVSQNIALAYAAVKKPADPKIAAGVEKAIAEIKKNTLIPEKHKQKLIKNIRKGAEKNGLLNQPKGNVELVRRMKGDIDAVITAGAK
jgi:hypothetical protein